MDNHLTDLDSLALTVREMLSRGYIIEAIRSYRAGAYKAAIVSAYVAVTYDIAIKIRELAAGGEKDAKAFAEELDEAIEHNARDKLLKIEGNLIDDAFKKYQFLGPQDHVHLLRLKEDRNICAHPAFASDSELFQPSPELVRAHIVHAITCLLSQPPVQGKAAIAVFAADIASASFPNEREKAVQHVIAHYLKRMRPALVSILAKVIVKGLLRDDVKGWHGKEHRLMYAIDAISRTRPELWDEVVRDTAIRILPSLEDAQRIRAFRLLAAENRFWAYSEETTKTQFVAILEQLKIDSETEVVFSALNLLSLREPLLAAFDRADDAQKLSIIFSYPHVSLSDKAVALLAGAKSFRGAEKRFASAILPMARSVDETTIARVLLAIQDNAQIWDAGGIPAMLTEFATVLSGRGKLIAEPWIKFIEFVRSKRREDMYHEVETKLRSFNVPVPEEPQEEGDDDL